MLAWILCSLASLTQLSGSHEPQSVPASIQDEAQSEAARHEAIHREMARLLQQVEARQREIDRMLRDAGTAHGHVQTPEAAPLSAVLEQARDGSRQVTQDIDQVLALAASHTHQGAGGA